MIQLRPQLSRHLRRMALLRNDHNRTKAVAIWKRALKIDNDTLDLFRETRIDFPSGLRKSRFP